MGSLREDSDSNFDGYINEDNIIGLQDHGGHVQQEDIGLRTMVASAARRYKSPGPWWPCQQEDIGLQDHGEKCSKKI